MRTSPGCTHYHQSQHHPQRIEGTNVTGLLCHNTVSIVSYVSAGSTSLALPRSLSKAGALTKRRGSDLMAVESAGTWCMPEAIDLSLTCSLKARSRPRLCDVAGSWAECRGADDAGSRCVRYSRRSSSSKWNIRCDEDEERALAAGDGTREFSYSLERRSRLSRKGSEKLDKGMILSSKKLHTRSSPVEHCRKQSS